MKHLHTAYCNVQPLQILKHLNTRWCPLDVNAKKMLKAGYWDKWDGKLHIAAFGKCLDDEQVCIKRFGITISNKNKLQFYLKQMYFSNRFDQPQMTTYENKPEVIKNNWDKAKQYFKGLIRDFKVYEQNSGGTAGRGKYESANATANANKGDKLWQYIATITAAAVAKDKMATNIRDSVQKKNNKMAAQLKTVTNAMAKLTVAVANKENQKPNNSGGGSNGTQKPWKKLCCMGSYCWSHGYHATGDNHTSATCTYKKEGHRDDATATNIMGGSAYWPPEHRVIVSQRTHASYAGKAKPAV